MNHPLNPPTVLVIDDEMAVRTFFAKALELGGYLAIEAATAEAALRLMDQGLNPDAVLLDVSMPGMGGLGFLLQLRSDPVRRAIPVAIVTGHLAVPQPVLDVADALGVAVHHKPVDMEALLTLTSGLLSRHVH